MLKKFDGKSLKFKIWGYFVLFAAAIMLILWLLQIVFLKTIYQTMKTQEIKKIGETIVSQYGKSDFDEILTRYQFNNGIVVQIVDEDGNSQDTYTMFSRPRTDPHTLSAVLNALSSSKTGRTTYQLDDERVKGKVLVYGAVLSSSSSEKLYLIITSQIAPIDSTTSVLQTQLLIVMIISLLLSTVISILIATKLSRPITKITKTANELAKGNYDVRFETGNYTEINQLASTLNYATTELSKTDELRRELIANVSHDLRTPLTMVKMYAELIRDVSGDKPEKRNAHTQVIIEESDRLSSLITDVLDLSKLQSGTAQLNLSEFDLSEKSKTILNRFHALVERDGYIFNVDCDDSAFVNADETKIEQVIYNLVSNAINYTGKDKTVSIRVKKQNGRVRFEVTDTGRGIPEEELKQIWERYYRAKEVHKRAVVGSGLGLSIVKGILDAHHAGCGVDSTVGKGSTFWFELQETSERDGK